MEMAGNPQDEPTDRQDNTQSKRGVRQLKNRRRNREIRRLQKTPPEDDLQIKSSMMADESPTSALSEIDKALRNWAIFEEKVFVHTNARLERVDMASSFTIFVNEDSRAADWELLNKRVPDHDFDVVLVSALVWNARFETATLQSMPFANAKRMRDFMEVNGYYATFYRRHLTYLASLRERSYTWETQGLDPNITYHREISSGIMHAEDCIMYGEMVFGKLLDELSIQNGILADRLLILARACRGCDADLVEYERQFELKTKMRCLRKQQVDPALMSPGRVEVQRELDSLAVDYVGRCNFDRLKQKCVEHQERIQSILNVSE